MNKTAITIIGWLFTAAGAVGFAYHATELNLHDLFGNDLLLALSVRLCAVAGGILLLRGADWGRWILAVWMVYHVVLSAFHSIEQTAMHAVLFSVIAYFLFRPEATEFFRHPHVPGK